MRRHESSTEQKYRELLAQQAREGLSRQEIAARAGIKPSTLTWWRCELKRRDREGARARPSATTLLPVTIRETTSASAVPIPAVSSSASAYEVVLGRRVLRVPRGFEPGEVHALVRVLEATPC